MKTDSDGKHTHKKMVYSVLKNIHMLEREKRIEKILLKINRVAGHGGTHF